MFCKNCGAQVKDQAAFCPSCGGNMGTAAAAKSSPLLKIVLIGLGIVILGGILIAGGVAWLGYKAVKTVERAAADRGVDFSGLGEKGRRIAPCTLLTAAEAGEILGETVARAETNGNSCDYYIQPRSEAERRAEMSRAMENMEKNQDIEQVAKSFTGGTNDGSTPYLRVEVTEDGKIMMSGARLALGAMGESKPVEELRGVADDAAMLPMDSMLMFLKNGTGVQIDLRQVPKGRERGLLMARRMMPRM